MKTFVAFLSVLASAIATLADSPAPVMKAEPVQPAAELLLREVHFDGRLSDDEARFVVNLTAEATGKGESSLKLFEGDVAVLPGKLPEPLKVVREGNCYRLIAARAGRYSFKLELVARIQRGEPWNQVSFAGPVAAIASVSAQAAGAGMEVQLLSGTLLESAATNGVSRVKGFLGADQTIALRWQGKVAEIARKTLLTVDSSVSAQITPTVIKYTTKLRYDIVQGNAPHLTLALPASQALTRLVGEQIRDWQIKVGPVSSLSSNVVQILTIEFIKPVEKQYELTLFSEQTFESAAQTASLNPPQPLAVERESGGLTLSAEDTLVEVGSLAGLRQINATGGAIAAYRFNNRPFTLALKIKRIEPVINVADRVSARLEETRLLVSHALALNVEKAGIYLVELLPQTGFVVADVRGEGVDDWRFADGRLRVSFSARLLGPRQLDVQLEQALRTFPDQIAVAPLRLAGAAKETAQIGAASAPGIRLKTAQLDGLREIPVRLFQSGTGFQPVSSVVLPASPDVQATGRMPVPLSDELLAFIAEQPDWKLSLASEHLAARIVADVFNLVTIGDGIVGGSATIRYGLIHQGVQEFKVKLPPHCKNVEFTGPNIRRKEVAGDVWTIGLQDKAWGGYTLVVTYDYQFDPKGATLPVGGIRAINVERETGSVAITTAASLQLKAATVSDTLRRVDEAEMSTTDRALITRAVVLAYQYAGESFDLTVEVKRYGELPVLEAVADRTQITSVLTEAGEMLTQASFMVKNNEKQFQRFELPKDAKLWGCYVNGQAVKPESDRDWVLVPLPRDVNRDQAFAVDIVYAEKQGALASRWSKTLQLRAPRTDVPNTYAEWELYVPAARRLSGFGGSMSIAQGTTYGLFDAWQKFLAFYIEVIREAGAGILVIGGLGALVIAVVASAARRGWSGVITVLGVICILAVLAGMMLPALAKAKAKAQRFSSVNNLKQIGLATRIFAGDNGDRLPVSFEEMMTELSTDKITYDTTTGQRYVYLGGGMPLSSLKPESVLAYSTIIAGGCNVLFADGSVSQVSAAQFAELSQRGLVLLVTPQEIARQQQQNAVMGAQFQTATTPAQVPGGVAVATTAAGLPATPPIAPRVGIRSIRIELPRTGTPFVFTKVLNVRDEPLAIRAKIMSLQTFQTVQMAWQIAAFLFGLLVWWWQWQRRRNSLILTVALALIIGSVGNLLIAWRALHDALIVGLPVAVVAGIAFLVWRFGSRRRDSSPEVPPLVAPEGGLPHAAATIVLLLALSPTGASAAQLESTLQRVPGQQSEGWTPTVSILSANYTGTVDDRVAQLDATLQLSASGAGRTVPLFGEDVAVQQFTVKKGDAKLVRDGKSVAVQLGRRGELTLQVRLLVKVAGDVTKRHLTFAIPQALSSQVAITLDQPEADVDFPTAISFQRVTETEKTRVMAVIGSGERVELQWTPRVKRAAEVAATVFTHNAALVTFGGGVVNVRSVLDYQVTQGELRQARVRLPAGQRLLRVEGLSIRTWEIKDAKDPLTRPSGTLSTSDGERAGVRGASGEGKGEQILIVDLLKGVSPAYRLIVETEKVLETLPASVAVELPHALDVKRETGLVALRGAEELSLSVESASDLRRVDAEEFARAGAGKVDGLLSVFRFLNPDFALRARAETVQPQIEAMVRNNLRVAADQVSLSAVIDFTIKRAGVFALKIALPENYRLEQVTGQNLLQWTERAEGGARLLEVILKERTSGAYPLRLELTRSFREVPRSLAVVGVHPLSAVKLTGFVAVAAESGVSVKTEAFDGLTEVPAVSLADHASLGGAGSVLAYKFITSEPKPSQEWTLSVTTESLEAWVRAEIVNTITLTETLASGRALVRYDIANAPVKELRLRVPAAFRNVEIMGPNIRRRDQDGEVWRVELQGKTRGFYTLTVTWELPRAARSNGVDLAGVTAEGVERETGLIAVVARPPLQVTETTAQELTKVDTRDLPDWAGRADEATVLAYRYVRPGYQLTLDARRFAEAAVLQALVDNARLTTVVADDGQMMTEMTLSVRNNGRQFLEIELPPGATVWSAFVAGQPVRPSRREGKLLLPLEQSSADDAPLSVQLTYVGTNSFPRRRGKVDFASPKLDVPLKNAQWELYLPPDYDYDKFGGSMTREIAAAKPSLLNFTLSDYVRREKAGKAAALAETKEYVNKAQRKLEEGNVREAAADFNRAKGNNFYDERGKDAGVQQLEKQLRSAQASNLINAQNDFSIRNLGTLAGGQGANPAANIASRYDSAAAEQQWTKLQAAQEVVVAKVQPLHVNLPVRGLRVAFNQVLQTEINKPMTIQLQAANTKSGNSMKRMGMGGVGFVVLWAVVAVVAAKKGKA